MAPKPRALSEFAIISQYFMGIGFEDIGAKNNKDAYSQALAGLDSRGLGSVELGIGDDCAILSLAPGQHLALSIDTLVAGRHFPADAPAFDIASRALAVAISDLAAMGARPLAFTLALTLPEVDAAWLEAFSRGLRSCADFYHIPLIGGDTTRGPLSISIQVHGSIAANSGLKRSAAKPGDTIYVSGPLGDGAAALAMLLGEITVTSEQQQYLYQRFYQPVARVALGQRILSCAHAAIDISDGLLADVDHICTASGVAAVINASQLPRSAVLTELIAEHKITHQQALLYALTGGDDYELCVTVAEAQRQSLEAAATELGITMTAIGCINIAETTQAGVRCLDLAGQEMAFDQLGFQHF